MVDGLLDDGTSRIIDDGDPFDTGGALPNPTPTPTPVPPPLTITSNIGGTISGQALLIPGPFLVEGFPINVDSGQTQSYNVAEGQTIGIFATPIFGYTFSRWVVNGVTTAGTNSSDDLTLTLTQRTTIIAEYVLTETSTPRTKTVSVTCSTTGTYEECKLYDVIIEEGGDESPTRLCSIVSQNLTSPVIPCDPTRICPEGWIGDPKCSGPHLVRMYRDENCDETEETVEENASQCSDVEPTPLSATLAPSNATISIGENIPLVLEVSGGDATKSYTWECASSNTNLVSVVKTERGCIATGLVEGTANITARVTRGSETTSPRTSITVRGNISSTPEPTLPPSPPTPTPTPTPQPLQWRSCVDGKLYEGAPPTDYRSVTYQGIGGGICWEPITQVGLIPTPDNIIFTYRRGSGKLPDAYKFTAENPSSAVSYSVKVLTNNDLFAVQPSEFQLRPRQNQDFTISVRDTAIETFGDGTTLFDLQLEILEIQ